MLDCYWLIGFGWLVGRFVCRAGTICLVDWFWFDGLISWFILWVGWLVDRLVGCLADRLGSLVGFLIE